MEGKIFEQGSFLTSISIIYSLIPFADIPCSFSFLWQLFIPKNVEEFWFKYSEPTGRDGNGPRKWWTWTKIMNDRKLLKKTTDNVDTQIARETYSDPVEFINHFSYQKG